MKDARRSESGSRARLDAGCPPHIGRGCTVHLRAEELPTGRLVVSLSKHVTAVVNGVIRDTHDPSHGGTRCVYGYFTNED